jgi:hypothetical protein
MPLCQDDCCRSSENPADSRLGSDLADLFEGLLEVVSSITTQLTAVLLQAWVLPAIV